MAFALIGSESHFPLLDTNSLHRNNGEKINATWVVLSYVFFFLVHVQSYKISYLNLFLKYFNHANNSQGSSALNK